MNNIWQYSTTYHSPCKIVDTQTLWGETIYRVWLPDRDAVVKVSAVTLQPLETEFDAEIQKNKILYISAAAKIVQTTQESVSGENEQVLLSPIESNVIPLPHQVSALKRAISKPQVRYLIADEVGLGKTIEAGLIMRELKLRGMVKRTLIIAPKSIATQWVSEMQTHFNENFQLVMGEDIATLKRIASTAEAESANPWSVFDQTIVTLDAVKPMEKRRGWDKERVAAFNADRFESLISAGWDLVIVDEAHRLGGSSEQVARHKLGKGLAEVAPYMLLLSATPHQGKRDAFWRLMRLLDKTSFIDEGSITKERVREYTIRTEKRKSIDGEGNPLFKPRKTQMLPVSWKAQHHLQKELYEAVTEYVRLGYNQAVEEKKRHIGFLMVLMQRLVVSSTRAIRTTLQRRLEVLKNDDVSIERDISIDDEEYYDSDAEVLVEKLLQVHKLAVADEVNEVSQLLKLAQEVEQTQNDAKAEALIDQLYTLQTEESDPELKILIFTEFVPTQQMLMTFLQERGFSIVTLNGSMSMEERKKAQDDFAEDARILISTDAGGEGLNLQFCHVVINYDIPWNPMRLEQRIGRVDRIGQAHTVRAINFVFEESVEYRVREVLEEKLSIIYEEFGVDKTADVLDSAESGEIFEEIFTSALLHPEAIETQVENSVEKMKREIEEIRKESEIYSISDEHNPDVVKQLRTHPLPFWVERMTKSYLKAHNGEVVEKQHWSELKWPDGHVDKKVVFSINDAMRYAGTQLLNLENSRVRGLTLNLPEHTEAEPIPVVTIDGLPDTVFGSWGLFEIVLQTTTHDFKNIRIPAKQQEYITVFISDEGKLFIPTSKHIWEILQTANIEIKGTVPQANIAEMFNQMQKHAQILGEETYKALKQRHLHALKKEEERGRYALESRRQSIMKVGLEEVRTYRLKQLDKEQKSWEEELERAADVIPQIRPILLMQIIRGSQNA